MTLLERFVLFDIVEEGNLVIIDSYWFSGGGAVICQDKITREYKAYIKGRGQGFDQDEDWDKKHIANMGDKLPLDIAEKMFPRVDQSKDWIEDHPEYFV